MARDTRRRGMAGHVTAGHEPKVIDWASPKQEAAFRYGPWPICASGGYGSAKTFAFCLKAMWLSSTFPNNRGLIARKESVMLRSTTQQTFFKICPPESYNQGGRRADSENILQLNNGSTILWMHLDDPETENVIRGLEINWFFLDQGEEIQEEIFDHLLARLGRWDQAVVPKEMIAAHGGLDKWEWRNPATGAALVPTYAMLACNPDTELHWIYRRFHPKSPEWREKYRELGYKMIQMDSRENKYLPKQNLEAMLRQDKSFIRRFVKGEWGIPEGQIHYVDDRSLIQYTPERLAWMQNHCTLHRTMDHGDASPTSCLWWAVDHEGNCIAFREYYQPNKLVSDHRKAITDLSKFEHYQMQLADPSIFFLTQQKHGGRWSTADEYAECRTLPRETAIFWQPGDNNELGTRNRINEYLRVDPEHVNPFTKEKGAPRLYFMVKSQDYPHGIDHALTQLRMQRRLKVGTENGKPIFSDERDDTITDHGYDPIRYFIASRPPVSVELDRRQSGRTFDAVRKAARREWKKQRAMRKMQRRAVS